MYVTDLLNIFLSNIATGICLNMKKVYTRKKDEPKKKLNISMRKVNEQYTTTFISQNKSSYNIEIRGCEFEILYLGV